jgi:hypothetical protein
MTEGATKSEIGIMKMEGSFVIGLFLGLWVFRYSSFRNCVASAHITHPARRKKTEVSNLWNFQPKPFQPL